MYAPLASLTEELIDVSGPELIGEAPVENQKRSNPVTKAEVQELERKRKDRTDEIPNDLVRDLQEDSREERKQQRALSDQSEERKNA